MAIEFKKRRQLGRFILRGICMIIMLSNCRRNWSTAEAVRHVEKRGIADSFTEGVKNAGKMFGINTASDVANLVAKAFSNVATSQQQLNIASTAFQQKPSSMQEDEDHDTSYGSLQQNITPTSYKEQDTKSEKPNNYEFEPIKENAFLDLSRAQIITSVLRMIGFDARKLGALALNALIMIAQVIGNTLMGTFNRNSGDEMTAIHGGRHFLKDGTNFQRYVASDTDLFSANNEHQPRQLRNGSPFDWFLDNPTNGMKDLLRKAISKNLINELTAVITRAEKRDGSDKKSAACLKLLVCKSAPFIWGMQKSVNKRLIQSETLSDDKVSTEPKDDPNFDTSIFFTDLPNIEEFRENGARCQRLYGAFCSLQQFKEEDKDCLPIEGCNRSKMEQ